jgi:hypothetical protein
VSSVPKLQHFQKPYLGVRSNLELKKKNPLTPSDQFADVDNQREKFV